MGLCARLKAVAGELEQLKVCGPHFEAVVKSPNLILTPSTPASVLRVPAIVSGRERKENQKTSCAVVLQSVPLEQLCSLHPPREQLCRGVGGGLAPPTLCKDLSVPCRCSGYRDPSAKCAGHSLNKGGYSDISGKCSERLFLPARHRCRSLGLFLAAGSCNRTLPVVV